MKRALSLTKRAGVAETPVFSMRNSFLVPGRGRSRKAHPRPEETSEASEKAEVRRTPGSLL